MQTRQDKAAARQQTKQTDTAASQQGDSTPRARSQQGQQGQIQQVWRDQQQHQLHQQADAQSTAGWQQVRRRLKQQAAMQTKSDFNHQAKRVPGQQAAGGSGYQAEGGFGHQAAAGQAAEAPQNVAMLTAIPPTPCKAPLADLINSLSLANKVRFQL